jgi:hypothetical protein
MEHGGFKPRLDFGMLRRELRCLEMQRPGCIFLSRLQNGGMGIGETGLLWRIFCDSYSFFLWPKTKTQI